MIWRLPWLGFNLAGAVAEAKEATKDIVHAPCRLSWGGEFQEMEQAESRMRIVIPLAMALVAGVAVLLVGSAGRRKLTVLVTLAGFAALLAAFIPYLPPEVSSRYLGIGSTGTLLVSGIPLVQALDTAAQSLNSRLLRSALGKAQRQVKEGLALSAGLSGTKMLPGLAIDMIEVGESTGALPAMLSSVAEFYEEDVNTKMTATLALIEPVIMIFMGAFVAFVLVSLYLPIFSLAETM